jgi:hypothetical protein
MALVTRKGTTMSSHVVYSTDTATAVERARRTREGVVVACPRCDRKFRIYVATVPTEPVVCGPCEDWG